MTNILYKEELEKPIYFERTLKDYLNFCNSLKNAVSDMDTKKEPVFLCIGTDRMTGDCLGPLVGHKLSKHFSNSDRIFGTLEHPVHALNLEQNINNIIQHFENPFFIVVDAALGLPHHIGRISLMSGALTPGEGMKKKLPAIGDLSITGIVAPCRGNACHHLQNARLHLVNELADFIAAGILNSFSF